MSSLPPPRLSVEQYDALERESGQKYEHHDGEVFAMSGASNAHVRITTNLAGAVGSGLNQVECIDYGPHYKLSIPGPRTNLHPDYTVVRGDSPSLIVEVLSPTTENHDRGAKFEMYSRIPSLRDYLLIFQDRFAIDSFSRNSETDAWRLDRFRGAEATVKIASMNLQAPLSDFYSSVNFDLAERSRSHFPLS